MVQKCRIKSLSLILLVLCALLTSPIAALDVVATTSVLEDPIQAIGGEHVRVISVADPTICPHMQGDIIDSRIQLQKDFIASADLFVAHGSSMDKPIVMPAVEKFMKANYDTTVEWIEVQTGDWNTPEKAYVLADEVRGLLTEVDSSNSTAYQSNYETYCDAIDAADLTEEESVRISGQDVVVMVWQQEAAEEWLGLNVVSIFGPEFYMKGQFTPAKVVDDINANPEKYQDVKYVIENMQSGEMAKGIEEALRDHGIKAERVIFTNFPKSIAGVESIPSVLAHNKEAVMKPARRHYDSDGSDTDWGIRDLSSDLSAGEESEFCFEGCTASRVIIVPEEDIDSLVLTAEDVHNLPRDITTPENATYRYIEITPSLESVRDHCEAWIEFSVPESWLKDEGIGPLDIVMIHYHDDAWQVLETGYLGTTDTMATYRARCTGFSYFAITVLPGEATLVETPAPTLTMGVNESIHATPSGAPTATLAQAPAKTETTTPPKEVPPQTTPQESPIWATVPFCALAVAIFGALRRP